MNVTGGPAGSAPGLFDGVFARGGAVAEPRARSG
jgi:hypothetical protein